MQAFRSAGFSNLRLRVLNRLLSYLEAKRFSIPASSFSEILFFFSVEGQPDAKVTAF
jgi:hypothetical protein